MSIEYFLSASSAHIRGNLPVQTHSAPSSHRLSSLPFLISLHFSLKHLCVINFELFFHLHCINMLCSRHVSTPLVLAILSTTFLLGTASDVVSARNIPAENKVVLAETRRTELNAWVAFGGPDGLESLGRDQRVHLSFSIYRPRCSAMISQAVLRRTTLQMLRKVLSSEDFNIAFSRLTSMKRAPRIVHKSMLRARCKFDVKFVFLFERSFNHRYRNHY